MRVTYYFFRRKHRRVGRGVRKPGTYNLLHSDDTKRHRPHTYNMTLDDYNRFDDVFDGRRSNKKTWKPCHYLWRLS